MIFAVLGIEKTKDEDAIRNAYRERLTVNHPEENPEGFKRLRDAYEQALAYARDEGEEEAKQTFDDSPVGHWMCKVDDTYMHISKRLDDEAWNALVHDDICVDLEYAEECKHQLFVYLMDHFRLKASVYRVLNAFFDFEHQKEEFYEFLPVSFVDFMIRRLADTEGDDDFPFEWSEGEDDADYDGFYSQLMSLEEAMDYEKWDEARELYQAVCGFGIRHPYLSVIEARFLQIDGDIEQAVFLCEELIANWTESVKTRAIACEILYDCNEIEKAFETLSEIEKEHLFFRCEKYLMLCEIARDHIFEAVEHGEKALRCGSEQEVSEKMKELSGTCIAICEEKLAKGELSLEEADKLLSAYSRVGKYKEGVSLILDTPGYLEQLESAHYYLTLFYFHMELYEKSIEEAGLWYAAIKDKGEDNNVLAVPFVYIGQSYGNLAREEKRHDNFSAKRIAWLEKAKEAFLRAVELAPENPNWQQEVIDVLIAQHRFTEVIEWADRVLEQNAGWFPAIVQKQRACYELEMGQECIDLFYQAKEIYPAFPSMYVWAARTFLFYHQFEDALDILNQAKEAEVDSLGLKVAALTIQRRKARATEDDPKLANFYNKLMREAKALQEEYVPPERYPGQISESEEDDLKATDVDVADLYYEMAIIEDNLENASVKMRHVYTMKALSYRVCVAYLYEANRLMGSASYQNRTDAKLWQERLSDFLDAAGRTEAVNEIIYNLASAFRDGDDDLQPLAVYWYEKLLEYNPRHAGANLQLAEAYRQMAWEEGNTKLNHKALQCIDTYIEEQPEEDYGYLLRAIVSKNLNMFDEGMEAAKKSVELDNTSPYNWNILGKIYFYKGQYKESLECLEEAVKQLSNPAEQGRAMYENAAKACEALGAFSDAEKWYQKGMEIFESYSLRGFMIEASDFYLRRHRFDDAKQIYEKLYDRNMISYDWYIKHILMARLGQCSSKKDLKRILIMAKQAMKKDIQGNSLVKDYYATILTYYAEKEEGYKLKKQYVDGLREPADCWDNLGDIQEMAALAGLRGDRESAAGYAAKFIKSVCAHYKGLTGCGNITDAEAIEMYCDDPDDNFSNMSFLGTCYLYMGELKKAEALMKRLEETKKCRECMRSACEEHMQFLGQYYELKGDFERAFSFYLHGFKHYKLSEFCRFRMVVLGRKLKKKLEEDWL